MAETRIVPSIAVDLYDPAWAPVESAGRLVFNSGRCKVAAGFRMVRNAREEAAGQDCDGLEVTLAIADDQGRVFKTVSAITTYQLFDRMWARGARTMDSLERYPAFKSSDLVPVMTKMTFWSDGRDHRVVRVTQNAGDGSGVYLIREKYLAGEIDLCILRPRAADEPVSSFVVVWRSFVEYSSVCDPHQYGPTLVCGQLSPWEVLLPSRLPGISSPTVFVATPDTARPNPNVTWEPPTAEHK